ncbi:hypothetical protein MTO96_038580 [Rhipicephalus appendiculatus]
MVRACPHQPPVPRMIDRPAEILRPYGSGLPESRTLRSVTDGPSTTPAHRRIQAEDALLPSITIPFDVRNVLTCITCHFSSPISFVYPRFP